MENTPLVPRQRNRRADRQPDAVPQAAQQVQQDRRQVNPQAQPGYTQQPSSSGYTQAAYNQQTYRQTPRTMYQQPEANQPRQQATTGTQPAGQTQYAPRPQTLQQRQLVNSGWKQPTLQNTPRVRTAAGMNRDISTADTSLQSRRPQSETPSKKKAVPKKLPRWMTWTTVLLFFLVLSLFTAYWLMQAYLVTEEKQRAAAWQATLNNYHITEQSDGRLTVTWQEHIEKYAAQYNLQPAFVTAIIRNESSFRTNAESSVGARGLMQLMPDTAEWIAGKLDDSAYTFDSMWDAETNIRYGCWYLGYLTRLFHGDPELISAAYHAGQTTVTQWLSDRTKSSDGVSLDLDKLSDGPTKQYIGRVTQTYGIYQTLLYPDEAFGTVPAGSDAAPSVRR